MKGTSLNEKSPEVEVNVATESDVGSHEKPFIDPVEEAKLLRKVRLTSFPSSSGGTLS